MIRAVRVDHFGAVELFEQHDFSELVREGHFRHRHPMIAPRFELFIEPEAAADNEREVV